MISAERLREIEDFPRGANMMRVEAKVLCDAYRELEAARTRIAELINEVAAHHFVRNERDRLLEQLRAQGLSQEDREALEQIDLLAFGGTDDTNPEKERCKQIHSLAAAILRRLDERS